MPSFALPAPSARALQGPKDADGGALCHIIKHYVTSSCTMSHHQGPKDADGGAPGGHSARPLAPQRAQRTAAGSHEAFVRHFPCAQAQGHGAAGAGREVDEFPGAVYVLLTRRGRPCSVRRPLKA